MHSVASFPFCIPNTYLQKTPILRKIGNEKSKNRSAGAKSTVSPKDTNGVLKQKRILRPKSEFLGPKKVHFLVETMFKPRPGKVVQEKSTLFQNKNHSFSGFRVFFWEKKTEFWPDIRFLAKRKNGRFSVIPAGTRSVVNVGHFIWWPRWSYQVSLTMVRN